MPQVKTDMSLDSRGCRVLRIVGFDLGAPECEMAIGDGIEMVFEGGESGIACHRLVVKETPAKRWWEWVVAARNTLPLVPNRSYLLSALIDCDWERSVEVNIGIQTLDGGGKIAMSQFNGLPNKTDGWRRWEWEITTDPQAAHGRFEFHIYNFPALGKLRVADIPFVELPPKEMKPFAKGEGASFRGGPGNLPMRIEAVEADAKVIVVRTTGARYTLDLDASSLLAEQLLETHRPVAQWQSSLDLRGLEVLEQDSAKCLLANDRMTIGVQCDSLVMVVPHHELTLACTSRIGGKWNRLAHGHLLAMDDLGGFAVNPCIPLGTGRLARVDVDQMPSWLKPGSMDFSGRLNDVTFISSAEPGWTAKWHVSPGERIGISVFPPRPYPWAESFNKTFSLTHAHVSPDAYAKFGEYVDILILWEFVGRAWAMSWGREHVVTDPDLLHRHLEAIHQAGMRGILYMSPWFYYSRDPEEFASEVRRLRDTYALDGVYYDGLPVMDWTVAYEEMRLSREALPDGLIILHHTFPTPLMEPSIELPAVASYADVSWMAELVYGVGRDWVYPKFVAQYRKANCVGAMLHDHWHWGSRVDKDLMMLRCNGRASAPSVPWDGSPEDGTFGEWVKRYLPVVRDLHSLWEQHGGGPEFYKKHYLPKWEELTRGQLPGMTNGGNDE